MLRLLVRTMLFIKMLKFNSQITTVAAKMRFMSKIMKKPNPQANTADFKKSIRDLSSNPTADLPKPDNDIEIQSLQVQPADEVYPLPVVVLEKGKARLFQEGNPLVYNGAIKKITGDPAEGSYVAVEDHMGNSIGKGIFNPHSTYRVRMLTLAHEKLHQQSLREVISSRIQEAVALRQSLGLPSSEITAYRLINGEGDRLGGLIVDVLGATVVIQSSALWVEKYQRIVETALKYALDASNNEDGGNNNNDKSNNNRRYLWRQSEARLKQDGFNCTSSDAASSDNSSSQDAADLAVIMEHGVKYAVNPDDGQKTGFYCDQRDNRQMLRSLAMGKSVLDMYCYSGGFALNCALGGAKSVISVDASQAAIDIATENARLNGVENVIECIKADAVDYMRQLRAKSAEFDLVICDPPKFAPTRASLDRAKNKYIQINTLALSLVNKSKGGLLLTCSCSAAVTQSPGLLLSMVREAAKVARRDITVVATRGACGDHPVHSAYPEGAYLTALLLRVT